MLEKVQQRKGRFPLAEVLAQGLAQTVAVGCIVEGIVSQLEGDAESAGRIGKARPAGHQSAPPAIAPILHAAAISPAVLCSMIRKYSGSGIKGLPL